MPCGCQIRERSFQHTQEEHGRQKAHLGRAWSLILTDEPKKM